MSETILPEHEERATESEVEAAEAGELAADEFYFDGPFMVFTGVYHLRRGYCCNSDCRHCPYK